MNKTIRLGAAGITLFAALGMGTVAHAQDNSAEATARAEVLEALELINDTALDFGTMVVSGNGTVTLAADGTLDCTNANIVCSGTTSVAGFSVDGSGNQAVTINLPTSAVTLQGPGFSAADNTTFITLNGFTSSENGATAPEVTLDNTGAGTFDVGGTIELNTNQVPGVYEGQFTVSVEYS